MSQGQKSRCVGDGRHPTFNSGTHDLLAQCFNRNPYNGFINPYGIGLMTIPYYYMERNNGTLDPGTYETMSLNHTEEL